MSSYLTFYLVPKAEDSKPLDLISYSRNNNVYNYFNENLNPAYIGIKEIQYTELNISKIDLVLDDINSDINSINNRLLEYEKHANGNIEIIEEILNQKEYLKEVINAKNIVEFIKSLILESTYSWSNYNKVLCNIS